MANEKNTENQSAFKELVLPVIVLVAICLLCSALLAVLNDDHGPHHRGKYQGGNAGRLCLCPAGGHHVRRHDRG